MNDDTNIEKLSAELRRLNAHPFLRSHSSWWRMITYQLLRGLAFGLGSAVGASVLVALLVWFLGNVDFIPVIGDWAKQILDIIENSRG